MVNYILEKKFGIINSSRQNFKARLNDFSRPPPNDNCVQKPGHNLQFFFLKDILLKIKIIFLELDLSKEYPLFGTLSSVLSAVNQRLLHEGCAQVSNLAAYEK